MEFGGDNYEDFFDKLRSHTGGPRNLRQIFDDDEKPLQYESNSLRYQPQKSGQHQQSKQQTEKKPKSSSHNEKHQQHFTAPATTTSASKADARWTSIVAKVAKGYNGTYKLGRVGVALMMNELEPSEHKLIIYKSKQLVLSTLLLKPNTKSPNVILKESYIQFYDDKQQFWSLRFESLSDEQEFIKTIIKHGLPLEQVPSNVSNSSANANANSINTSAARMKHNPTSTTEKLEKLASSVPQPQPRPRQHKHLTVPQAESEEELEDIIVTPVSQAIASTEFLPIKKTTTTTTSLALATKPPDEISSHATADKLEIYLVEQRAAGRVMEKKIDSILQVMSRLTTGNGNAGTAGINSRSFSGAGDTLSDDDKEDELLELEQKLLNFKKENRALIKALQAKEQALNDLRSSTCALCDQLVVQNRELKQQNASLLAGMAQLRNQQVTNYQPTAPCQECDKSAEKIALLELRVLAMQSKLGKQVEGAPC